MHKISLSLKSLQNALATVSPAVQRNTTIPALTNVRIEPLDGAVELTTTNLELSIVARVDASDTKKGAAVLLPAAKLESYAKLLDGQTVSLALEESKATLRCGRSNTKLPMLAGNQFPAVKVDGLDPVVALPEAQLGRALDFTAFAIAADESRYTIDGAQIESDGKMLQFIATDGHRCAVYSITAVTNGTVSMLAPRAFLAAVAKVLDDGDDAVQLSASEELVGASAEGARITHRKLAGRFPQWRAIVPKEFTHELTVKAEEMEAALRRASSFADRKSGAIKFTFTPGETSEIRLYAVDSDTGETDEQIDVTGGEGLAKFVTGFSGSYLLDAFSRLSGDVMMRFYKAGNSHALMIVAEPAEGERFEYIVMPLRVE